jgi:hypothetical protein
MNIRVFPAFLQDQREVQTATGMCRGPVGSVPAVSTGAEIRDHMSGNISVW